MHEFVRAARRAIHRALPHLLSLPHVVGAGAGWRERGGEVTGEPALVVFVIRKLPPEELPPEARVPERVLGFRTDVIPVGYPRALGPAGEPEPGAAGGGPGAGGGPAVTGRPGAGTGAHAPAPRIGAAGPGPDLRLERVRPAPPGVSIGHYRISAGTLGALVRDRRTGQLLILSNNHVLANRSTAGDRRAYPGDPILQPGPSDGGTPSDVLATLVRYVPLHLHRAAAGAAAAALRAPVLPWARILAVAGLADPRANRVDAAVAAPVEPEMVTPEILGLGLPRPARAVLPGAVVRKSGRTTGVTSGRVRAVAATVHVDMGAGWAGMFADQVITTPMAAPGDSGSLLLDAEGHAVGLISAGSSESTIANHIGAVLEALDVELVV